MDTVTWCIMMRDRAILCGDKQGYKDYDAMLSIWKGRSGIELCCDEYLQERTLVGTK